MADLSLRVTHRCLTEDLSLPDRLASEDASDFADHHQVVRVFVDARGTDEESGEPIQSLRPFGAFRSLHIGRGRAVTTLDAESDVCWLLAYDPYHAAGDRKDVYAVFERLHERGELLPTADDYERLFDITPEGVIESLRKLGPGLIAKARAQPGQEVVQTVVATATSTMTTTITVDLVFEVGQGGLEEGWVGLQIPPNFRWPATGAIALATALIPPDVPGEFIQPSNKVGPRSTYPAELAFSWSADIPWMS